MNLLLVALLLQAPASPDTAKPVAIKGARILTVSGAEIESGTVIFKDGKIDAVGADVAIPAGMQVVDGKGLVLMPGLIHAATRIGASASGTGNAPDHLAIDELAPSIDGYRPVVRAGFTTLALYPAGGPIAGQAVAYKPRGVSREAMSIQSPAYLRMEMEASTRVKEQIRLALEGAKRAKDKKDSKPDDRTAPLVNLLKGDLRGIMEIRTPGEYLHFRQILKPFDDQPLKLAILGGTDLWRGAEALGARKETVLLRPDIALVPDTRIRVNPSSELAAAGCTIGFVPYDSGALLEAHLFRVAQIVKGGFSRELALKGVTLVPAQVAGVDKRVGSIEKGKDADALLLDDDPFSGSARILKVYIDGRVEHEAAP